MSGGYRVRGGIEPISDSRSTGDELRNAAKEVKELATPDASFSRGKLYLLDDRVVFAPAINESTVGNVLDRVFSFGPVNVLRTLGVYDPYGTSLDDADQYPDSWELPYSEIGGISLLSKSSSHEVFLQVPDLPDQLFRVRVDEGTDYIGFYRGNRKAAKKISGNLFDRVARHGEVSEFDAGAHFTVRTKQVGIPKSEPATSSEPAPETSSEQQAAGNTSGETPAAGGDPSGVADARQTTTESGARVDGESGQSGGSWRYLLAGLVVIFGLNPAAVAVLGSPIAGVVFLLFGALLVLFGLYRIVT